MRALAILSLLFVCHTASAQLGNFEIQIMFETAVGETPAPARTVWKAPAGTPATRSLAFGRPGRFLDPIRLSLRDSVFEGTGLVPPPREIRAVRIMFETGRLTVEVPQAGWEEGVAAARLRFEPREGPAVTGEGQVYIQEIPSGAQFNIGMPPTLGFNIGMPPTRQ